MSKPQRPSQRIADWLVTFRWEMLAVTIVIATLAVFPASNVLMDRSISTMLAEDDPMLPSLERLGRVFGGNDILLAVYDDPELFNKDGTGLNRLIKIRDRLEEIDGVKGTLSVDMILGERILDQRTLIPAQVRSMFEGFTHGEDFRTTSVVCLLDQGQPTARRSATIAALRREIANLPDGLPPGTLAGEPVMLEDAFNYVDIDGKRLFTVTTVLLAVVILVCFRSLRWVLVPIAVVQLSLLLTNATVGLLQLRLSMVSSMLTAVVTVIGVATVVHVIVRFRECRKDGADSVTAMRETARLLAKPVFWACITDAVGFAALLFADVGPVRDFGLMMALGSLMVLISVALLIPGLALFGRRASDPRQPWGEKSLDANLLSIIGLVYKRPWLVGVGALGISLVAIYGIRWLEVETDFTRNFRDSTPIVQSYELVESKLGGAGVLDIVVPAPEHLTWDYLRRVLALENDLRRNVRLTNEDGSERPGIRKALSLADAVVAVSPKHPDRVRWRRGRAAYVTSGLRTMRNKIPHIYDALYGSDPESAEEDAPHYLRVMIRAQERQPSSQKQEIISQVTSITQKHFPEAEVTGYFPMLTGLIDSILRDQWKTFGVALAGIFLTMTVAFRSIRFALIATIPNALPVLVVSGLLGWLGLKVNMGGAMIAAVSMGLSIDSSIHYLMAYKRARAEGKTLAKALKEVQQSVGRAMVFSTLALIIGFAALAISQFVPTIYFGVLVSISMLGALFGNLVWLPLMLRLLQPSANRARATAGLTAAVQKG